MESNNKRTCFNCPYGRVWDMSVDDLTIKCYLSGDRRDYCDMESDIMYDCPCNGNPSIEDLKRAKKLTRLHKKIRKILYSKNKFLKRFRVNIIGSKISKMEIKKDGGMINGNNRINN